jgi:hypothetical protein
MKHRFLITYFKGVIRLTSIFCVSSCALIGGTEAIQRAKHFEVKAPENWKAIEKNNSDFAYRTANGGIVTLTSSCERTSEAPLEALTRHLLIGARDVKVIKREKKLIGSSLGLSSRIITKADGQTFYIDLFVSAQNKCVFDFALINANEISKEEKEAFYSFIASFENGNDN